MGQRASAVDGRRCARVEGWRGRGRDGSLLLALPLVVRTYRGAIVFGRGYLLSSYRFSGLILPQRWQDYSPARISEGSSWA